MLLLEHWTPASHPENAAFRSQSCASFGPHAGWHCDEAPLFTLLTQQTWPGGQFAAPLHLRAEVSPPGQPPSTPVQEYATP